MALIIRVRTIFSGVAGTPAYSNLYFDADSTVSSAANTAVGNFWNAADSVIDPAATWATDSFTSIIDTTTGNIVGTESVTPVTGTPTGSGSPLPPATQMLLRLRTPTYSSGRRIQGRVFIPYLTSAGMSAGKPTAGSRTFVQDAADVLVNTSAAQLVIYSKKNGTLAIVTSADVWDQYAVMRSRRD